MRSFASVFLAIVFAVGVASATLQSAAAAPSTIRINDVVDGPQIGVTVAGGGATINGLLTGPEEVLFTLTPVGNFPAVQDFHLFVDMTFPNDQLGESMFRSDTSDLLLIDVAKGSQNWSFDFASDPSLLGSGDRTRFNTVVENGAFQELIDVVMTADGKNSTAALPNPNDAGVIARIFVASDVPEPPSIMLLALGLAWAVIGGIVLNRRAA